MERKVDHGIRASLAGLLILTGVAGACRPNTNTETTTNTTPTVQSLASKTETLIRSIEARHGIPITAENPNSVAELEILDYTLDHIPAVNYLFKGGFGIHKYKELIRTGGMVGAMPFLDYEAGLYGLNIFIPADFNPSKMVSANDLVELPTYVTYGQRLQYEITKGIGHAFASIVYPERYKSYQTEGERETVEMNDPLFVTFAQVAGFEYNRKDVWVQQGTVESGTITWKQQDVDRKSWYPVFDRRGSIAAVALGHVGDVEGEFADYFAVAILNPKFLPTKAKNYFELILDGLSRDPENLIARIRQNPAFFLTKGLS